MVFLLLSGISVLFFVRFLGPYQNINHWYELFSDLIINNRSTMVALKYVEQKRIYLRSINVRICIRDNSFSARIGKFISLLSVYFIN